MTNTTAPKFEVDGVIVTSKHFMHGGWWYEVDRSWHAEENMSEILKSFN